MSKVNKQIRQTGFSKRLKERLDKEDPELGKLLSQESLTKILVLAFEELIVLLRDGYRVIFEGYFSFFTKPIKRKCFNLHTKEEWWTFKRRIRFKSMPDFKKKVEIDIPESEYLLEKDKEKEKVK